MKQYIFEKGRVAPSGLFVGKAYVNMLVTDPDNVYDTTVYNVIFEAGSRNNWHSHPQGQLLLCTDGVGYYQEKGQPARRLVKGEIVEIPHDTVHWHGAAPDSEFEHIGITPMMSRGEAVWYEPVTDEEYKEATANV